MSLSSQPCCNRSFTLWTFPSCIFFVSGTRGSDVMVELDATSCWPAQQPSYEKHQQQRVVCFNWKPRNGSHMTHLCTCTSSPCKSGSLAVTQKFSFSLSPFSVWIFYYSGFVEKQNIIQVLYLLFWCRTKKIPQSGHFSAASLNASIEWKQKLPSSSTKNTFLNNRKGLKSTIRNTILQYVVPQLKLCVIFKMDPGNSVKYRTVWSIRCVKHTALP